MNGGGHTRHTRDVNNRREQEKEHGKMARVAIWIYGT
jgi:hypothetical protein